MDGPTTTTTTTPTACFASPVPSPSPLLSNTNAFCQEIVSMNNVAIAHLLDHRPEECVELLRYALATVRNALATLTETAALSVSPQHQHQQQHQPQPSTTSTSRRSVFLTVPLNVEGYKSASTTKSQSVMEGGTFAFFDRMVTLSPTAFVPQDNNDDPPPTVISLQELLAHQNCLLLMLFFNMAVCHHHYGIQHGKSQELTTALRLYELALGILDTSATAVSWGDQQLLLLGMYNNVGCVHASFCNAAPAQTCLEWVQRVFRATPRPHSQQHQPCHHNYDNDAQQHADQEQDQPKTSCPTERQQQQQLSALEPYDYQFFIQYIPINPKAQCNIASAA